MYQTGQEKPGIQTSLHLGNFCPVLFYKVVVCLFKQNVKNLNLDPLQGDNVSTVLKLQVFQIRFNWKIVRQKTKHSRKHLHKAEAGVCYT